jgi:DNA repair protein RecO (recombination protein O)
MLTKDAAICIRATDFSETSQVLTLFTRATGKINAIAKGSKRPKSPFDGPIELFSHGNVVFSDSNRDKLATLTEFEQQTAFSSLSGNLFALNCALFAAELVNNLTDDYDPHPKLFDSFLQFLRNTNEIRDTLHASRDTLSLLILFQFSLLRHIGLIPIFDACVNCKTKYEIRDTRYEVYFSSSANGLICKDCEASFPDKISLTNNAANCLLVLSKPVLGAVEGANAKLISQSNAKTLSEIEKLLIHHFTELLGRPPKMAKYILKN